MWSDGALIRGKYRILQQCGAGAMAVVYKAEHIPFQEVRALKVINADLANDESFVRRFKQEALLARRLQHPNVVRIDDIEEAEDGRPFIVMEFIEGSDMGQAIQNGPMPLDRVVAIGKQVASALDAAHRMGMIHRDIKPANILLGQTAQGEQAKVADFGIAKLLDGSASMTQAGRVIGSPAYMSPEQALGSGVDGRTDIYSLGVLMYQAISGKLPLTANSTTEFQAAQANKPPVPIRTLCPNLPERVADLIMSCLEKDRERRPPNGKAFIAVLEAQRPVAATKIATAPLKLSHLSEILTALGYFLILWGGVSVHSPAVWFAAAALLCILDAVCLPTANKKRLVVSWVIAALLPAALAYYANPRIDALWAGLEESIEIRPATIQWLIAACCALLFLAAGGSATLRSVKAVVILCGIFVLVIAASLPFDRSAVIIAVAGGAGVLGQRLYMRSYSSTQRRPSLKPRAPRSHFSP